MISISSELGVTNIEAVEFRPRESVKIQFGQDLRMLGLNGNDVEEQFKNLIEECKTSFQLGHELLRIGFRWADDCGDYITIGTPNDFNSYLNWCLSNASAPTLSLIILDDTVRFAQLTTSHIVVFDYATGITRYLPVDATESDRKEAFGTDAADRDTLEALLPSNEGSSNYYMCVQDAMQMAESAGNTQEQSVPNARSESELDAAVAESMETGSYSSDGFLVVEYQQIE